jgi:hypothetical protein
MPVVPLLLIAAISIACADAPVPTGGPASASPTQVEPTPVNTDIAVLEKVLTSCWGLGQEDCRRVVEELQFELTAADPLVTYIQVGPFGCDGAERCPTTLAARPQGDVTLQAGAGALSYHVTAAGDGARLAFQRQDAFGVLVRPTSQPPAVAGPRPFTLGHCGLSSGIDVGGIWWVPIGQVDAEHPDTINSAKGTFTIIDPGRATFRSEGGLTVQLARHPREQFLPLCD